MFFIDEAAKKITFDDISRIVTKSLDYKKKSGFTIFPEVTENLVKNSMEKFINGAAFSLDPAKFPVENFISTLNSKVCLLKKLS